MSRFASKLLCWHAQHGRHDLPWVGSRDPYRVWVSEIMLQQTQVASAAPYYRRFMRRFPNVQALARAPVAQVLKAWAGLGYYTRARNLHACAQRVVSEYGGCFPQSVEALASLPGIGPSTAAAIAAFCFDAREAILDGNVKRVLARVFAVEGFPGASATQRRLWALAQSLLPRQGAQMPAYTQALMDLGATVCTRQRPACERCPMRADCEAYRQNRVLALPTPRPARQVPRQEVFWLMVCVGRRVWLQRQPARGLWAGMLAFPQLASPDAVRRAAKPLAGAGEPLRRWPAREHVLTHRRLQIQPYVLALYGRDQAESLVGRFGQGQWLTLSAAARAEVPAAVSQLLRELTQRASGDG